MSRQAYDADVVCIVFASELSAKTDVVGLFKHFLLQFNVAESAACLIACCRKRVVIMGGCQFNCQQVLLCRCAANHECNVVWRTSGCAESLHLGYKERNQSVRIQNSFCLLIEICFVCRATTFGYAQEWYSMPSVASMSICAGRLHFVFTSSYIDNGAFWE